MKIFEKTLSIYQYLDLIWVFFVTNFNWRIRAASMRLSIHQFSTIESDTSKQLYQAYLYCDSKLGQKILLAQILDELNHAEVFKNLFPHESLSAFSYLPEQRRLVNSADDLKYLILYCHVGEAEAAIRFKNILRCFGNQNVNRAIQLVLDDEEGHVATTRKLLKIINANYSRKDFNRDCLNIFINRRFNIFKRMLQNLMYLFVRILLVSIYYLLGLFIFPFCRNRMNRDIGHLHSLEINAI